MITRRNNTDVIIDSLQNENSELLITDLDFNTGDILKWSKALINSYKFWLKSRADDFVRQPNFAGFFDGWLRDFEMNETGAREVEQKLISETKNKFERIELLRCVATPNPYTRTWKVEITPYDTKNGLSMEAVITLSPDEGFIEGEIIDDRKTIKIANKKTEYTL